MHFPDVSSCNLLKRFERIYLWPRISEWKILPCRVMQSYKTPCICGVRHTDVEAHLCVWEKERLVLASFQRAGWRCWRRSSAIFNFLLFASDWGCLQCVRAEAASDLSLISRYSLYVRGRSSSAQNTLYVIGLKTSQDATTKPWRWRTINPEPCE